MAEPDPFRQQLWESGWEAHTLAQRRRLAGLSLTAKLEWLEDAQRLVAHLAAQRSSRSGPGGPSPAER